MSGFEKFILGFAKAVVVTAPSIAPIFIHSKQGVLIFNASDEFAQAALEQLPGSAGAGQ